MRVLVVDDTDSRRRMLVRQLARAGPGVVGEAATAQVGVAEAAAAPDVVLLELHLPGGLGTEVAARLRADHAWGRARGGSACGRPAVEFCMGDVAGAHAAGGAGAGGAAWAVLETPASADALDWAGRDAAARRRVGE